MAIEFTKVPVDIVFNGNPITIGVRDVAAFNNGVKSRCVLYLKFLVAINTRILVRINYNTKNYNYYFGTELPYKDVGETMAAWITRVADAMLAIANLENLFYIKPVTEGIVFIEKEVLGNITVYAGNSLDSILQNIIISWYSDNINLNQFSAIGIQIREIIDFSLSVGGDTIDNITQDYGSSLEIISAINYSSEDFLRKIADGSLFVEEDISSLLKFKKRGHFNITDSYKIYDLTKRFTAYAYKLSGTPPVKQAGSESDLFRVMDAKISRIHQANLNETEKTLWEHLVYTNSFMSWAPDNKILDVYFPEILYFPVKIDSATLSYWAKEFYDDDTDSTYQVCAFTASKYDIIMLSAALLKIKSNSTKRRIKYQVWVQDYGSVVSEVRTYIMSYKYEPYARYWAFKNSFGVYEIIRTTGKAEISEKISKTFIEIAVPDQFTLADPKKEQTSSSRLPVMKVGSGPLNEIWAKYYLELFDSVDVYLLQKGKAIPASISPDEFVYKIDGENISPHIFNAELTGIDENRIDTSQQLPIDGDYLLGDFDESFFIGNI